MNPGLVRRGSAFLHPCRACALIANHDAIERDPGDPETNRPVLGDGAVLFHHHPDGEGLSFLGIEINRQRNAKNAPLISPDAGCVKVRVIRTDEELMIARSVTRALSLSLIKP